MLVLGASVLGVGIIASPAGAKSNPKFNQAKASAALLTLDEVNNIAGLPGTTPPNGALAAFQPPPPNPKARRPCNQPPNKYTSSALGQVRAGYQTSDGQVTIGETLTVYPNAKTAGKAVVDTAASAAACPAYAGTNNGAPVQIKQTTPAVGTAGPLADTSVSWDATFTQAGNADLLRHYQVVASGFEVTQMVTEGSPPTAAFNVGPAMDAALTKSSVTPVS